MRCRSRLLPLLPFLAFPLAAQRQRAVIVVPGQITQVLSDTVGTPYDIPFPVATAYHALLAAYRELKVPLEVQDSLRFQVGSATFHRTGTFAGAQISTWMGCGDGASGPNADSYRVYMILNSSLQAAGPDRTVLRTGYLAGAVSQSGASNQPMPCESTGRLEIRLHKMVLKAAAGL